MDPDCYQKLHHFRSILKCRNALSLKGVIGKMFIDFLTECLKL